MKYPIFDSIINQIEQELNGKDLNLKIFKTWHEDRINAAGLEIAIDVSGQNNFIKEVTINFDWDRFREAYLARHLEGLGEHPALQEENLKSVTISPNIDIELSWVFDQEKTRPITSGANDITPTQRTREWMETLSESVNKLFEEEQAATRWHFEMEGNSDHKYLSSITLISYFHYSLEGFKSLNEVLTSVKKRVRNLMIKTKKVRQISDDTLKNVA